MANTIATRLHNIEVGERIKFAMKKRNLTIREIARRTCLPESTISRYKNGIVANIKLSILGSIAKSLQIELSWLMNGSENDFEMYSTTEYECTKQKLLDIISGISEIQAERIYDVLLDEGLV